MATTNGPNTVESAEIDPIERAFNVLEDAGYQLAHIEDQAVTAHYFWCIASLRRMLAQAREKQRPPSLEDGQTDAN